MPSVASRRVMQGGIDVVCPLDGEDQGRARSARMAMMKIHRHFNLVHVETWKNLEQE